MNLDKQVSMLQEKIDEQDATLTRLRAEEEKLTSHIKQFKEAIKKKTIVNAEQDKNPPVDIDKMSKQLQKEVDSANLMLKNYQNELKAMQKRSNKVKTDDLAALEQTLKEKESSIKKIKQEIKDLQFVKRKQEKVIEKKMKDEDGGKLTRVIEEVRKNKQALDLMELKYKQKEELLRKKKQNLVQLEKKYREKCEQNGEKPMSFEEFKDKKKERRREDQSVSRPKVKKAQQSVREIIHSQLPYDKLQCNEKTLKQLRQKRDVVENSLKNAHKKHEKEIQQLNARLEQLQSQNESLNTRLMEKRKQKQMAQNGYIEGSKHLSSKTTRKLTPLK